MQNRIGFVIVSLMFLGFIVLSYRGYLTSVVIETAERGMLTHESAQSSEIRQLIIANPQISVGSWKIVLYRDDCSRCIDEIPPIIAAAKLQVKDHRWGFVNIGKKSDESSDLLESLPGFMLKMQHKMSSVAAPMILEIQDGKVSISK